MATDAATGHGWLRALLRAAGGQSGPILHCDPSLMASSLVGTPGTYPRRRRAPFGRGAVALAPAARPAVTWRHGAPLMGGEAAVKESA